MKQCLTFVLGRNLWKKLESFVSTNSVLSQTLPGARTAVLSTQEMKSVCRAGHFLCPLKSPLSVDPLIKGIQTYVVNFSLKMSAYRKNAFVSFSLASELKNKFSRV
jgi:hypothetical protein